VDDYFILVLAGHGGSDGKGGFFFTARDFSWDNPSSRINSDEILAVLNAPGKRMVFIESCHSGGVTGGESVSDDVVARILKESNALVFTAARGNLYSYNIHELQHGILAYSIIKSIKEGRSGTINMLEFLSDISNETLSIASKYGVTQDPQLSAMSFENFPIIVRRGSSNSTGSSSSSTSSYSNPFTPSASYSPPSSPPPSRPSTPPKQTTSSQLWGVITDLAIWGLNQLFK